MIPEPATPPSRLSRLAFRPGGTSPEQAIAAVSARLEPLRDGVLHELGGIIAQLQADCAGLGTGGVNLAAAMYERCNHLIGLAGWFGLAPLVQAAFSLCALLDRQVASGVVIVEPVVVHVRALQVLSTLSDHEAAQAVLDGLGQVAARV